MRKMVQVVLILSVVGLLFGQAASASYGEVHVAKGSNTNGPNFQYWLESLVEMYGWTGAIENARDQWNSVSGSNANLTEIYEEHLAQIRVYMRWDELDPGVFGETAYYQNDGPGIWKQVSAGKVASGTDWDACSIEFDVQNSQGDFSFTWDEVYKLAGHEFGHALGLRHFQDSAFLQPAHQGDHWMVSGPIELTAPTQTDKDHLAYKW